MNVSKQTTINCCNFTTRPTTQLNEKKNAKAQRVWVKLLCRVTGSECDEKVKPSFMSQTELRMRSHFKTQLRQIGWTLCDCCCYYSVMRMKWKNKIELDEKRKRREEEEKWAVIPQWINVVKEAKEEE
jgi:hypothetical protein